MKKWRTFLILTLLGASCQMTPIPAQAAAGLELYGTFEAMGVIVHLGSGDDPNGNATAQVEYRASGSSTYQPGFPLSRVAADRFVGSLFWLTAGMTYDVRVSLTDPDGGALNGTSLAGSAATQGEITIPTASHSYYAHPAGSGTACTLASPCGLTTAISQAQAGEEVVLRGGVYAQGEMSLPRSGAAGAPILLHSYTNETAILDGGDPATFSWTAQGGGVYRATVNAANPHLVTASGQRLYPYQSLADLQSLSWGIPGFYANGTTVYVRLAGDANPNTLPMTVSRFNNAFTIEQNYIYLIGLTFKNYGRGDYAKALYFYDASYNLVQGCTFLLNDLSIGLKYGAGRNVIEENTFSDTDFDWPWEAVKAGSELETGGIRFYSPVSGRGNILRNNTFHDFFDGFGACPEETDGETNETDVYENLVYRAGDDGMETDGTCSNVRIWGNTFHDVLSGISMAPVYTGPIYAVRNLIYRTGAGNNDYPGLSFKFNSGYDASGPMFLFHNTAEAVLPGSSGLDIKSPGEWAMITARNNIWSGTDFALYNANPGQPLDLDYDDLQTTQAGELAWWDGLPDRHLNTLAELRSATGQELHGYNLAPVFNASASGDYTLAGTSPLIDKGVVIPGINNGYNGSAPDLGAFEFQPALQLQGTPGDQAIQLNWNVNASLDEASTWTISYSRPGKTEPPITGLPAATRAATLTGLLNYALYTITLSSVGTTPALSATIQVMPTDQLLYLPIIRR
jgi:parallel beta-helix repeat protein